MTAPTLDKTNITAVIKYVMTEKLPDSADPMEIAEAAAALIDSETAQKLYVQMLSNRVRQFFTTHQSTTSTSVEAEAIYAASEQQEAVQKTGPSAATIKSATSAKNQSYIADWYEETLTWRIHTEQGAYKLFAHCTADDVMATAKMRMADAESRKAVAQKWFAVAGILSAAATDKNPNPTIADLDRDVVKSINEKLA